MNPFEEWISQRLSDAARATTNPTLPGPLDNLPTPIKQAISVAGPVVPGLSLLASPGGQLGTGVADKLTGGDRNIAQTMNGVLAGLAGAQQAGYYALHPNETPSPDDQGYIAAWNALQAGHPQGAGVAAGRVDPLGQFIGEAALSPSNLIGGPLEGVGLRTAAHAGDAAAAARLAGASPEVIALLRAAQGPLSGVARAGNALADLDRGVAQISNLPFQAVGKVAGGALRKARGAEILQALTGDTTEGISAATGGVKRDAIPLIGGKRQYAPLPVPNPTVDAADALRSLPMVPDRGDFNAAVKGTGLPPLAFLQKEPSALAPDNFSITRAARELQRPGGTTPSPALAALSTPGTPPALPEIAAALRALPTRTPQVGDRVAEYMQRTRPQAVPDLPAIGPVERLRASLPTQEQKIGGALGDYLARRTPTPLFPSEAVTPAQEAAAARFAYPADPALPPTAAPDFPAHQGDRAAILGGLDASELDTLLSVGYGHEDAITNAIAKYTDPADLAEAALARITSSSARAGLLTQAAPELARKLAYLPDPAPALTGTVDDLRTLLLGERDRVGTVYPPNDPAFYARRAGIDPAQLPGMLDQLVQEGTLGRDPVQGLMLRPQAQDAAPLAQRLASRVAGAPPADGPLRDLIAAQLPPDAAARLPRATPPAADVPPVTEALSAPEMVPEWVKDAAALRGKQPWELTQDEIGYAVPSTSGFDIDPIHYKDHPKQSRTFTMPDNGVIPLYHNTNGDPASFIAGGVRAPEANSVYSHQAPQPNPIHRYTVEFEAKATGPDPLMHPSANHLTPEEAYTRPDRNAYRTDIDYYGAWLSGRKNVPPANIKRIRDNFTGEMIYDRDNGGMAANTISEQFPNGIDRQGNPKARFAYRDIHEAIVSKALAEGKPVPPKVLEDYPDLADPPAPLPTPATDRAAWQRQYVGQSQAGTDILAPTGQVGDSALSQTAMNAMSPAERMARLQALAAEPAPTAVPDVPTVDEALANVPRNAATVLQRGNGKQEIIRSMTGNDKAVAFHKAGILPNGDSAPADLVATPFADLTPRQAQQFYGDRYDTPNALRRIKQFQDTLRTPDAPVGLAEDIAAFKRLTPDEQRARTFDAYRVAQLGKEVKGISRTGEEIIGYPFAPDNFTASAATGRGLRNYVELPSGAHVHPNELNRVVPDDAGNLIDSTSGAIVSAAPPPPTREEQLQAAIDGMKRARERLKADPNNPTLRQQMAAWSKNVDELRATPSAPLAFGGAAYTPLTTAPLTAKAQEAAPLALQMQYGGLPEAEVARIKAQDAGQTSLFDAPQTPPVMPAARSAVDELIANAPNRRDFAADLNNPGVVSADFKAAEAQHAAAIAAARKDEHTTAIREYVADAVKNNDTAELSFLRQGAADYNITPQEFDRMVAEVRGTPAAPTEDWRAQAGPSGEELLQGIEEAVGRGAVDEANELVRMAPDFGIPITRAQSVLNAAADGADTLGGSEAQAILDGPYAAAFKYFNARGNLKQINARDGGRTVQRSRGGAFKAAEDVATTGHYDTIAANLQQDYAGADYNPATAQNADEYFRTAREQFLRYQELTAPTQGREEYVAAKVADAFPVGGDPLAQAFPMGTGAGRSGRTTNIDRDINRVNTIKQQAGREWDQANKAAAQAKDAAFNATQGSGTPPWKLRLATVIKRAGATTPEEIQAVTDQHYQAVAEAYKANKSVPEAVLNEWMTLARQKKAARGKQAISDLFSEAADDKLTPIQPARLGGAIAGQLGGGVVGGAVGATQGDTPEERRRNALTGAAAGALVGGSAGMAGPELAQASRILGTKAARQVADAATNIGYDGKGVAHAWAEAVAAMKRDYRVTRGTAVDATGQPVTFASGLSIRNHYGQMLSQLAVTPKNDAVDKIGGRVFLREIGGKAAEVLRPQIQSEIVALRDAGTPDQLPPTVATQLQRLGVAPTFTPDVGTSLIQQQIGQQGTKDGYHYMHPAMRMASGAAAAMFNPKTYAQGIVGPLVSGAAQGLLAPARDAAFKSAQQLTHNPHRLALFTSTLRDLTAAAARDFLPALKARGVDVAPFEPLAGNFSPQQIGAASGAWGGHAERLWAGYVTNAIQAAEAKTKWTFGDYGTRTPLEKALGPIAPFVRWPLKTYPVLGAIAAKRAPLTASIVAGEQQDAAQAKREGRPGYDVGTVPLPGTDRRLNVLGTIAPIGGEAFAASADKPPANNPVEGAYGAADDFLQKLGLGFGPQVQIPAYMLGLSGRVPGSLSRTSGLEQALPGPTMPSPALLGLNTVRGAVGGLARKAGLATYSSIPATPSDNRFAEIVYRETGAPLASEQNLRYALAMQGIGSDTAAQTAVARWRQEAEADTRDANKNNNALSYLLPISTTRTNPDRQAATAAKAGLPWSREELQAAIDANHVKYPKLSDPAATGIPATMQRENDLYLAAHPEARIYEGASPSAARWLLVDAFDKEYAGLKRSNPTAFNAERTKFMQKIGLR